MSGEAEINLSIRVGLAGTQTVHLVCCGNEQVHDIIRQANEQLGQQFAQLVSDDGNVLSPSCVLGDLVNGAEGAFSLVASSIHFPDSSLVAWFDAFDSQALDSDSQVLVSKGTLSASIRVRPRSKGDGRYPACMRFEEIPSNPPAHDWRWERCSPVVSLGVGAHASCFMVVTPTDKELLGSQWQVFPISFQGPRDFMEHDVLQNVSADGGPCFQLFKQSVGGSGVVDFGSDCMDQRTLLQCNLEEEQWKLVVAGGQERMMHATAHNEPLLLYVGNRVIIHELMVYTPCLALKHAEAITDYLVARWDLAHVMRNRSGRK
eukprot:TRINITY_DN50187_c0_g1_i1.p1 TRINITY_DN50187_c0_g1~~TRINITY_DN50187_c0_g1_i1.p1  ORF type:complete len:338 (+),score=36.31 TRINITY_DN50187_c0_g1_i1:63-1016(+)